MNLGKQYNIPHIGTIVSIFYQTAPIFGIIGQMGSVTAVYGIFRQGILSEVPWLTLPVFISLMILVFFVEMFLFFKFVNLGVYKFQNTQQFPEDGPVMKAIRKAVREEIRAEMERTKEKHD